MLVDETNVGSVLYNHANFHRFEETSTYWSVNEYQFFSAFHWSTSDTPPASQCITVQYPILKALCRPRIAAISGCVIFSVPQMQKQMYTLSGEATLSFQFFPP